jgi:3-oxoadipate enol-lactonase
MPYIKSNGIEIYHETHGRGPAMLLIHGLGNDSREWGPLIERLEGRFTPISYDMRGSGRSDKPDGPYTMEGMSADAAGLLKEIAKPPVDVLGFSMGGCVALELALDRPELVRRLVLVSTIPSWRGPYAPSERLKVLFRRTDVSEELLIEVYETIFGAGYREKVPPEEYVARRMDDEFPQPVEAYLSQLAALEAFDVRDRVGSISAETLVVAGTDDRVVPVENSRWLADKVPGARLETIEGAGHMVPVERPGELAAIIA